MTLITRKFMQKVRRRLDKFSDLEVTACGHEELLNKAADSRERLLDFIERSFDELAQKAGEP